MLRDTTGALLNPERRKINAAKKYLGIKSGKSLKRLQRRLKRENAI